MKEVTSQMKSKLEFKILSKVDIVSLPFIFKGNEWKHKRTEVDNSCNFKSIQLQ